MTTIFAMLSLAVLCGAWGLFQLWISRIDPELHKKSSCCAHGCGNGSCGSSNSPDT